MNILYLCDEYPPGKHGGIGTAVQLLAREMVKMGHNVVVAGFYNWGYGGEDKFADSGVIVYRFRRQLASSFFVKNDSMLVRAVLKMFNLTGILQWDIKKSLNKYGEFLEEIIEKHKIDIVEMPDFSEYMSFCNSYVPFPRLTVPVIVKMHGGITYIEKENKRDVPAHIWQMEHDMLEHADFVTSVSKYNAAKTCQYLKYLKPVKVLYNGIEIIAPSSFSDKVKNRVIFTGALSENKGIYQLMKAWNEVNRRVPDAQLYVVGKGPIEKVRQILNNSTANSVIFKGHIDRVALLRLLSTSMVAVFPSYTESFGLAVIEAMMCGTASIYTTRATGPELIDDGINGLLADPDNVQEIADKIVNLLQNEDVNTRIATNGRQTITEKFDITACAKENAKYYNFALNKV